jgi:hypothetical protein
MRKGPSRRIGRSGNAMPLLCNTRSFDAADVPSQWAQLIRWLFVFNSRFARINQDHQSAPSSRQRFDHPHPPSAKDDAHDRIIGGKHPGRSERPVWRSESQTCKPHKKMTLSAFSNEGIANNRPYIDPSRCRSSLSFGNLRKIIAAMRYGYMEWSIRTTGICNKG